MARQGQSDGLDRIIAQRLAADRDASGEHCPDSSIISAYRDRGLGIEERAFWERHFAQCARCTGTIAAIARIDDAENAVAAVEGDARSAAGERRGWWKLRGAFPIAALSAAAAFAIVIAIRTIEYKRRSIVVADQAASTNLPQLASKAAPADITSEADKMQERQMAMNDAAPAKPVAAPPSSIGALSKDVGSSRPAASSSRKDEARSSSHGELSERKVRARELDKRKAEAGNSPFDAATNSADTITPAPSAAPNQVTASAPSVVAEARSASAAPLAPGSASGGVAMGSSAAGSISAGVVEQPRTANSSSRAEVGAGAMGSTVTANATAASPEREASEVSRGVKVESPDHSVAWMLGRRGEIMRYSTATGWVPQASGVTAELVAGSAPSSSVCWAVGRGGTIVRTIDGQHWMKIAAPATGDLTGVVTTSANDATITTADGQRYSTSDGGVTWQPQ